jgi:hypothetical protein
MNGQHTITALYVLEPVLSVSAENGGSVEVQSLSINNGIPVLINANSQ